MTTPLQRRAADLARLSDERWDLLIVGGGIVGAGAFLDAASRGMKVALVEQDDIAAGTSSRSSRLIHGGLRYLQQGEVGMVREALAERARLLRLAPHLVRLEAFLFPIYGRAGLSRAVYEVGLTGYDLLGSRASAGRHRHLGVAEFASTEYEADDLIGTLAHQVRGEGLRVTVVSRDKDLSQLIGPGDKYWDYADSTEYSYEQLPEKFGVPPERMADYLALMGDASDNIPGVPGIGPKTAAAIMQRYASLDALYDDLPGTADLPVRGAAGLAAKLAAHREAAFLARALTRIHCAAPMPPGRGHLERRSPSLEAVTAFCARHGFGAMLPKQAERIARLAA